MPTAEDAVVIDVRRHEDEGRLEPLWLESTVVFMVACVLDAYEALKLRTTPRSKPATAASIPARGALQVAVPIAVAMIPAIVQQNLQYPTEHVGRDC